MTAPRAPDIAWISKPAQVRALESPRRQEVVDALAALGPAPVARLAEHLGRAPDSLYFHVRKLVRVGILREHEVRKDGKQEWAVYALTGRSPRIRYADAPARSVQRVVAGALRMSLREFNRAFGRAGTCPAGERRNLWGGRVKGWLGEGDLAEVNRLLERLAALLLRHGPGPGRSLHSLAWVLAPAPRRGEGGQVHRNPAERRTTTKRRRPNP